MRERESRRHSKLKIERSPKLANNIICFSFIPIRAYSKDSFRFVGSVPSMSLGGRVFGSISHPLPRFEMLPRFHFESGRILASWRRIGDFNGGNWRQHDQRSLVSLQNEIGNFASYCPSAKDERTSTLSVFEPCGRLSPRYSLPGLECSMTQASAATKGRRCRKLFKDAGRSACRTQSLWHAGAR